MQLERYRKQMLFAGVGPAGQTQLRQRTVLLVGCGALGCVVADALVRAGVGHLRLVDRDFVELSNLQRQVLFTEDDVRQHLPKAVAAADRLQRVNSDVRITATVADADYTNMLDLASGVDLILDGTDNFEVRYLINDVALETGTPWIFTGCTGSHGQMLPIFPGYSACLRCLMQTPPPPGSTETCDTAGVLGPAIGVIASLQAAMAIRMLTLPGTGAAELYQQARLAQLPLKLQLVDVWDGVFRQMDVAALRDQTECPACKGGERLWLHGSQRAGSTVLCGRNAVQVAPPEKLRMSLADLARRLEPVGTVMTNAFLLRLNLPASDAERGGLELTVFPDGRAIIRGTDDPSVARSVYSRYIGT